MGMKDIIVLFSLERRTFRLLLRLFMSLPSTKFRNLLKDSEKSEEELYSGFKEIFEKSSIVATHLFIFILKDTILTVPEETTKTVVTALVSLYYEKITKKKENLGSVSECIRFLSRATRIMNDLTSMGGIILEGQKSYLRMFSFLLFYSITAINDILDKTSDIRKKEIEMKLSGLKIKFNEMRLRRERRNSMQKAKRRTKDVKKLTKKLVSVKGRIDSLLSSEEDREFDEVSLYRHELRQSMLQKTLDLMLQHKPRRNKESLSREEKNFKIYKKISFHRDEDFKCPIKALLDPINKAVRLLRKLDGDHTADIVLHSTTTSLNMACHIFGGL